MRFWRALERFEDAQQAKLWQCSVGCRNRGTVIFQVAALNKEMARAMSEMRW